MELSTKHDALRQQTAQAMDRLSATLLGVDAFRSAGPSSGVLFLFDALDVHPDLWAVIDRDGSSPERFLVVPADLNPLSASCDVPVPPESPSGALTLRCEFGLWLDVRIFEVGHQVGVLDSESLECAQQRWARIEAKELTISALDRDTEAELEYRDLRSELTIARRRLSEFPVATTAEPPRHSDARWLARHRGLAASVFLALAVGAGSGWLGRGLELEQQRQAHESARAESERVAAAEELRVEGYRQEISDLEQERAQAQSTIEDLSHRLEGAAVRPLADLPFEWLRSHEDVRGTERLVQEVAVPTGARFFAVFLAVEALGGLGDNGRVEIVADLDGRTLWQQSVGHRGLAEIFLLLPSEMFPTGVYILRLYPSPDTETYSSYSIHVTRDRTVLPPPGAP